MINQPRRTRSPQRIDGTKPADALSNAVIKCAIDVHRELGPGLLEHAYEECLAYELTLAQISFERQKPVPVVYKGLHLDCGFKLDFLVERLSIVELKAVGALAPIHTAQTITYLKLTGCKLGLLLSFNVMRMQNGIKRVVFNL